MHSNWQSQRCLLSLPDFSQQWLLFAKLLLTFPNATSIYGLPLAPTCLGTDALQRQRPDFWAGFLFWGMVTSQQKQGHLPELDQQLLNGASGDVRFPAYAMGAISCGSMSLCVVQNRWVCVKIRNASSPLLSFITPGLPPERAQISSLGPYRKPSSCGEGIWVSWGCWHHQCNPVHLEWRHL